ncbi:MAG: Rpn family recombination-promoting nuclease/putative transposase [Aeriscardovia sp.]|nr:Rpn family recombination-promoting nuclease/putative transposase [Aeriscardovia sp.]
MNNDKINNDKMNNDNRFITKPDLSSLPTGKIKYGLTNDYMFRAVFQENKKALEGLLYALLALPEGSIAAIDIENPIELGKVINDKTCILDLKIMLNDKQLLNIEMQVTDYGNWPERSLTYLCRAFDHLKGGEDYSMVRPTMHIGIIDFDLPGLSPEFYAEYMLLNTKNGEVYSDKFRLRVLNLNQINHVPEDYKNSLYHWAKLFKATTWEEIKMLAEKNDYMGETIVTMHQMTEDEKIAAECAARERYERDTLSIYRKGLREGRAETEAIIAEKDKSLAEKDKTLAEQRDTIAELTRQLEELKSQKK